MKIAKVETTAIRVPFTFGGADTGWGVGNWTTNDILLVRVETDTGVVGWGRPSAIPVSGRCDRPSRL